MKKFLITGVLAFFANTAQADFYEGTITYYDNLKTCTPHTFSYSNPMAPGSFSKNVISGKSGDKCKVDMFLPGNMKMECSFSSACIAALTSPKAYEDARAKRMSGSSSSPESQCLSKECSFKQ